MIKNQLLFIIIILSFGIVPISASTIESPPVKIACVGNSITYGASMTDRENNAYPIQLQNMLGDGFEVKNFGVSGCTLIKNGDLPYWKTEQFSNALEYQADWA